MKIAGLILLFTAPLLVQSQSYPKEVKAFDAYVSQAMKDWEIPGLSVVVVKDGKVLLSKGYGVRELGKKDAVTTQTLFSCASTTKAMTAACVGMLVDEGKIAWNDPVIKHLPDFQLYDPYVTRELKVRDLLTHNSGVGNTDFLWSTMSIPSEEVVRRMRMVEPTYSLRSSFIYQNIFYLIAGQLIESVSGRPWEQFIKERVFSPLKMSRTVPTYGEMKDPNHSTPHFRVDGEIRPIDNLVADEIGPAGSVWSCAEDMSKWVLCMLDSSKYPGGRLLEPGTWNEMFKPQVVMPAQQFYPTMELTKPQWITYAFGWFQQDYKGKKINFHTGSLPGTMALNAQLPSANLGYYFFGNLDHAELRHALMFKTFDLFALGGTRDWSKDMKELYHGLQVKSEEAEKLRMSKREMGTNPSVSLEQLAGNYADPLHGEIEVSVKNGKLWVSINGKLSGAGEHWHFDTYIVQFEPQVWFGKSFVSFRLSREGKVAELDFAGNVYQKNQKGN